MLPDPLHPAVVHFPLALSVLLPLAAAAALLAIRLGAPGRRTWAAVLALSALLSASAWFATETGEDQEGIVETVVARDLIHEHEEAGERLFQASLAVLLVVALGMAPARFARGARIAGLVAAAALVAFAVRAGHTGGELVYRHGAARAYVANAQRSMPESRSADGLATPVTGGRAAPAASPGQ